ncbi:MAG: Smr/MutS family protein, partial [Anaerovorax sp.]
NGKQEEIRTKLRKSAAKYKDQMVVMENPNPVKGEQLKIGDRVKILSLGQKGEVNSLPDDRNEVQVQVGSLKMNVKVDNLMMIQGGQVKTQPKKSGSKYGNLYRSKAQTISISINVRGQILDDAIMDVDKYLDDAYMAGLEEVTIIHGRGEGILREGIHSMLKNHKHVTQFRKGVYNEGGDGVTIVKLK